MKNNCDKLMEDLWINSTFEKQKEILSLCEMLNKENSQIMMKTKNQISTVRELEIKLRELIKNQQKLKDN